MNTRVLTLNNKHVSKILDALRTEYIDQHKDVDDVWRERFAHVRPHLPPGVSLSENRNLLIGAYFTMEYAVESAALFNPSIVPALDQTGLPSGSTRFLMSLRATGEGHLSSIVFRRGVVDENNHIVIETDSPVSRTLELVEDDEHDTATFRQTLADVGAYWWEMVIIGNCGSPLETDEGWLLLTHGVGPMRQYCIGAALLDLEDASRLIGQTREPLIVPTGEERVGYVPNVAYTCGAMIHNDTLIIPYAVSDRVTTFATVPLPDLLNHLKQG
jgi:hypothetical protein